MRENTAHIQAGSRFQASQETLGRQDAFDLQDARARRSGRAYDGWLASRMRAGAAARRRAATGRERPGG